jgi:hypothetical protein
MTEIPIKATAMNLETEEGRETLRDILAASSRYEDAHGIGSAKYATLDNLIDRGIPYKIDLEIAPFPIEFAPGGDLMNRREVLDDPLYDAASKAVRDAIAHFELEGCLFTRSGQMTAQTSRECKDTFLGIAISHYEAKETASLCWHEGSQRHCQDPFHRNCNVSTCGRWQERFEESLRTITRMVGFEVRDRIQGE